jgi:hypothetical protein
MFVPQEYIRSAAVKEDVSDEQVKEVFLQIMKVTGSNPHVVKKGLRVLEQHRPRVARMITAEYVKR